MDRILETRDLSAGYGDVRVITDIDMTVDVGEIVTILGPNGAGKSTLLKTIVGLLEPSTGSIDFKDEDVRRLSPELLVARGLAYVPEERELFPRMTIEENLEMGATVRSEGVDASLTDVYDLFPQLSERKSQLASTLSGGERQMLAIARGLMSDPELLLLDEPSLGLAPQIIETVEGIIESIVDSSTAVVLVEQNAEMAIEISDRGYILKNGSIQNEGPVQELRKTRYIQEAYM